jgi:LAO/AO transport system kinase
LTHPDTIAALVARLRKGDTRALARAISLVENDAPESASLLSACFPHTGSGLRIGITGAPGAGKSTLVDRLARAFRETPEGREANKTVGVIAVDPTSPFTGGAILGDRIRFQDRHGDSGFYARSMATRGSLGGLALATADVALVLEASGKDVLLIETVGVGQDEIEIARLADITVVVLVPGMGDDVQSLKAGVMEIADIFVVNKSDREGADRVEQEIRGLQSLASDHPDHTPPVIRTIATTGDGLDNLATAISEMEEWLRADNRLAKRRTQHWQRRLDAMLRTELMRRARQNGFDAKILQFHAARIASGQQDPWQLVAQLTEKVFSPANSS